MQRLLARFLAALTLLFVLPCAVPTPPVAAQGTTYYVATTGTDKPGCGTIASPCRTIQYAADLVGPGDTVLINPGTYSGGITVDTSGTASQPITFRANGTGVVINGSGGERDAFFITRANYIIVDGLTIQNATRAGMRISLSHHVTVRNCTFANNGTWGLFTDFSDYTTVEYCESYGAVEEHGIYISNSSDYPTIRGNRLHHNHANGLHMNGDISMGGDGIISYALIEDNVIYENGLGGGSGINMDGVTYSIIRNNLLYNNHASGISLYQIDGGSGSHHNRVLNNTIVMPSDGRWGINIPDPENPASPNSHNKLFNNIIYNYHSWRGSITVGPTSRTGLESDYNVVMDRFSADGGDTRITLAQWQALGYETHSIIATPAQLFVNPSAGDYHLKAGSPAINAGTPLADVTDDLEGNPRPVGPAYDIGAYEYQAYGFSLTANPSVRVIAPGGVATTTLSIQPSGGFAASVALTATSPSPALIVGLSPAVVNPPGQSRLTITDTHAGPLIPGVWYTIPITATGSGITQTASVRLLVGGARIYLPMIRK